MRTQSCPDSPAAFPYFITRLFPLSSPGPSLCHHPARARLQAAVRLHTVLATRTVLVTRHRWIFSCGHLSRLLPQVLQLLETLTTKPEVNRNSTTFFVRTRHNSSYATTGIHLFVFPGIVLNFRKKFIFWFCVGTPAMFRKKDPERVPLLSDEKNAANGVKR